MKSTIAIIGAGASGMFCAAQIGNISDDVQVVVLESSERLMRKVLLSGGGRCNFTNSKIDSANLKKFYPRGASILRKPIRTFGYNDSIEFFKDCGVDSKIEDNGRVFPVSDSSESIVNALFIKAQKNNVKILKNTKVLDFVFEEILDENESPKKVCKALKCRNEEDKSEFVLDCSRVVIATGGAWNNTLKKSLENEGIKFVDSVPSLFSLQINPPSPKFYELAGTVVNNVIMSASCAGEKFESKGDVLVTHTGFSGPATLELSSFGAFAFAKANYNFELSINFIAEFNQSAQTAAFEQVRISSAKKMMKNVPMFGLTQKFWEWILNYSAIDSSKIYASFSADERKILLKNLTAFNVRCNGKATHKEEFVTAGGVDCTGIDSNSMRSKNIENMYFLGECLNIDGITGGFNLQSAWTTATVCAENLRNFYVK